ncbi:transmembrane protein 6/97 [Infundibulicybe gibba]|nr:transmembrane protein 6/97 [Infundibulicybe gibba]
MSRLTSRPLDLLYFAFFFIHIPSTLLIDLQPMYPPALRALLPAVVQNLPAWYVRFSNDPLIGGALSAATPSHELVWFRSFMGLEAFFQTPVFFIGLYGLYKGLTPALTVLLLLYATSTATTTLPCIAYILSRTLLLGSYVPFFLIPLGMALDMAWRVYVLAVRGETKKKGKRE